MKTGDFMTALSQINEKFVQEMLTDDAPAEKTAAGQNTAGQAVSSAEQQSHAETPAISMKAAGSTEPEKTGSRIFRYLILIASAAACVFGVSRLMLLGNHTPPDDIVKDTLTSVTVTTMTTESSQSVRTNTETQTVPAVVTTGTAESSTTVQSETAAQAADAGTADTARTTAPRTTAGTTTTTVTETTFSFDARAIESTMCKQPHANWKKSGRTLAVGVVDMLTGESIPGVRCHVFAVKGEDVYEDSFDLGEWDSEKDRVMYFTGLPTDDSYTYYLDCRNLPAGYGNEYGNWDQQMVLQFGDKTDLGVNARIMKSDEVHNVCLNLYDWASDESACFDDFSPCCNVVVSTKDGIPVYGLTPYVEFALPDGEYHAELRMHPDYPLKQMDPDSEFAAYIQSIYPDVTFTDQTGGIDFAVVDGKPDRELRFDLAPLDGRSNSITVSCIDSSTGAPLEGVVISLIEAPDTYAKKVAEWTSDSTGTHTFDGLLHCGYRQHPAYLVRIDSIPAGYLGGYDADVRFGYINGDSNTVNYSFSGDSLPKLVSADVISFEDKSVMNDLTSFEVWKTDPNDSKNTDCIYKSVKPGESFYLPDGDYFAALNIREAHEKGYDGVSFLTRRGQQLKQFFNQQDFLGTAAMVQFKVVDGKPDRELKFYVKLTDPLEDEAELDAETLAKYEALWGSNV